MFISNYISGSFSIQREPEHRPIFPSQQALIAFIIKNRIPQLARNVAGKPIHHFKSEAMNKVHIK